MKKSVVFLIIAGLITVFILSNSTKSATESSQASEGLLAWLYSCLPFLKAFLSHNNLRKTAHFIEFFAQGSFLTLSGIYSRQGIRQSVPSIAFAGLFTACTDEYLQTFSLGRSPEVADVFFDFAGTVAAFMIITLLFALRRKKNVRI